MSERFIGISIETGVLTTRMTCDRCGTSETLKLPEHHGGRPYPGWDMVIGQEPYRDMCSACAAVSR